MPLDLKNASETIQMEMIVIFAAVKFSSAFFYLDDNVVYSKSPADHIKHVWHILLLHYGA